MVAVKKRVAHYAEKVMAQHSAKLKNAPAKRLAEKKRKDDARHERIRLLRIEKAKKVRV